MKAYLFDEHTKEYVGEIECQIDPLESKKAGKDIWLLPANSTFDKPMNEHVGYKRIFFYNQWVLFPIKEV